MSEKLPAKTEQFSRRTILKGAASVVLGVSGYAAIDFVGENLVHILEKDTVNETFVAGVEKDWHKLAIFAGMVVVEEGAAITESIFSNSKKAHRGEALFVTRPIAVRQTLRYYPNIMQMDRFSKHSLKVMTPEIPRSLVAYYSHVTGTMHFVDVQKEADRLTLLSRRGNQILDGDGQLSYQMVTVDKRDLDSGLLTTPVDGKQEASCKLIASSFQASSAQDTSNIIAQYISQPEFENAYVLNCD